VLAIIATLCFCVYAQVTTATSNRHFTRRQADKPSGFA